MSKSIKLNDNNFISSDGVIDELTKKTQSAINNSVVYLPMITTDELPSHSIIDEVYFHEWLDKLIADGVFRFRRICVGIASPNAYGWVVGYCDANNGYSSFLFMKYGDTALTRFGTNNGTWFYNTIA